MSHKSSGIIQNLSVDCVLFGFDSSALSVLLIKRNIKPEKGTWAVPGGFVLKNEDLDSAAKRVLEEMTGYSNIYMEQLHTFGEKNRYPVRRVITVAYYALIKAAPERINPGRDASEAKWHNIMQMPSLPFDHEQIVDTALKKLRLKVRNEPVGFELLPKKFTLTQLQTLYEAILGINLDKRNFRKKILSTGLVSKLDEKQQNVAHRQPYLYRFDEKNYRKIKKEGLSLFI